MSGPLQCFGVGAQAAAGMAKTLSTLVDNNGDNLWGSPSGHVDERCTTSNMPDLTGGNVL